MTTSRTASASWLTTLAKTFGFAKKHSSVASKQYGLNAYQTYMQQPGKPVWSAREYGKFAEEAYIKNVIAYRSIHMIASGAASIDWKLLEHSAQGDTRVISHHPALSLLNKPNPFQGGSELFESVISYRLISGNSYIQGIGPDASPPRELYTLRPDRMSVIAGHGGVPAAYRYAIRDGQGRETYRDFPVNRINGKSSILHLKSFHPLDDWYGLSPIEAAAYSIDQHNQSGAWNQSLLQNGARPSGALVVKSDQHTTLSEEQYQRLKMQMDEQFSGPQNAGRPVLLEGGLDWREMSLSPKDMDFINAKHSSARDIALAFGVPPQLLGIPGDNTYSNLAEARLALWEQTILPIVDQLCDALNQWLIPQYGNRLMLTYDSNSISALSVRREKLWERVNQATFLSDDEKRTLLGFPKLRG